MKKGFTLVELLAVIIVLSVISLITTVVVQNNINATKKAVIDFMNNDETEILETVEIAPDKTTVKPGETMYFVTKLKDYNGNYDINKARVDLK